MDLTTFLTARFAEDEAAVEDARSAGIDEPIPPDCWGPDRVLAECEAKRRIVERHVAVNGAEDWMDDEWLADMTPEERAGVCTWCTYDDRTVRFPCPDVRDLAHTYADHPDYREEWRP